MHTEQSSFDSLTGTSDQEIQNHEKHFVLGPPEDLADFDSNQHMQSKHTFQDQLRR